MEPRTKTISSVDSGNIPDFSGFNILGTPPKSFKIHGGQLSNTDNVCIYTTTGQVPGFLPTTVPNGTVLPNGIVAPSGVIHLPYGQFEWGADDPPTPTTISAFQEQLKGFVEKPKPKRKRKPHAIPVMDLDAKRVIRLED